MKSSRIIGTMKLPCHPLKELRLRSHFSPGFATALLPSLL